MHDGPPPDRPGTGPGNDPVLVADIGGTNTRLALADGLRLRKASLQRLANADHRDGGPTRLIRAYLSGQGDPRLAGACIAIAGPVRKGAAELTNLRWRIELAELATAAGTDRVALLNDLQAQGWALDHLPPEALQTVQAAHSPADPAASRLVVGMGTGFNAAPVHRGATGLVVAASECGHAELPVRDAGDLAFAGWIAARTGFATIEDLLSGRGIEAADLYAGLARTPDAQARRAPDAMAALQAGDMRAAAMAARVVTMLGRVCGDLALVHLPEGGIYLCGGVARAFLPHLDRFGFATALADKGRFAGYLAGLPVAVVTDDFAALTGCAARLAAG